MMEKSNNGIYIIGDNLKFDNSKYLNDVIVKHRELIQ